MEPLRRQNDERPFDLPVELQDEAGSKLARRLTCVIISALILLIFWTGLSPVEEVAVASGKIVPSSDISDVHHLEGGIVDKAFVREGQRVRHGDVIVSLRPGQTLSDFTQMEARAVNLRMKRARLTASLDGKEPDFGEDADRFPEIARAHMQTLMQERLAMRESERQHDAAIQVIKEQLRSARGEARSLDKQVALQAEQVGVRERSHEKGYISLGLLLEARSDLERTRQRLVVSRGRIRELEQSLREARIAKREMRAQRESRLTEERANVTAALAEDEKTIEKFRDRVIRLNVVAPIEGVVQKLAYATPGAVIKPGELIAQIIPEGGVVAEVELSPSDIGHVRVGNRAEIRLSNFDPDVVGRIGGVVERISPTTLEKPDGRPYYKARIRIDRDLLTFGGQTLAIAPGTTLRAQILTDSKSLLRYLMKPVSRSLEVAFSER